MITELNIDIDSQVKMLFDKQKKNVQNIANKTAKERIVKIKKVMNWVLDNESRIAEALYADHKKHPAEVKISEIMPVVGEAKYIIKHLSRWMRPEEIDTPLKMIGTSSKIIHEPKGNCLIISPWNYPFNLAIKPLLQAIAAGNVVILKPSEVVPHASMLISEMVSELFDENEIAVVDRRRKICIVKVRLLRLFAVNSFPLYKKALPSSVFAPSSYK